MDFTCKRGLVINIVLQWITFVRKLGTDIVELFILKQTIFKTAMWVRDHRLFGQQADFLKR